MLKTDSFETVAIIRILWCSFRVRKAPYLQCYKNLQNIFLQCRVKHCQYCMKKIICKESKIHYHNSPHFSSLGTFTFIKTVIMSNCTGTSPSFHTLLTLEFDCVLCQGFRFHPHLFLFQFIQYIWFLHQNTCNDDMYYISFWLQKTKNSNRKKMEYHLMPDEWFAPK